MEKEEFDKVNVFGIGDPNVNFAKYFTGESFLNPLAKVDDAKLSLFNVTFEPKCRNNWHGAKLDSWVVPTKLHQIKESLIYSLSA